MTTKSRDRVRKARIDAALANASQRRARKAIKGWADKAALVVNQCHPKQKTFSQDPRKRIAAIVGRRGGKTTGVLTRFVRLLLTVPNAKALYIAPTRGAAEQLMWAPIKDVLHRIGLTPRDFKANEQKLRLTFRNGAFLELVGADNKRDIEKLRGRKFHECWIDECGSYPADLLRVLIEQIIEPTLGDYDGVLGMIGTPSKHQAGPFWEVTMPGSEDSLPFAEAIADPDYDGWSMHRWTLKDGVEAGIPAMINAWKTALRAKARHKWPDDHPTWKREWLGLHAVDGTENIYKYQPVKQEFDADGNPLFDERGREISKPWNEWDPPRDPKTGFAILPETRGEWHYVIGMDLGHSDPFALTLWAFDTASNNLYQIYEFEKPKMYAKKIAKLLIGEPKRHTDWGGIIGKLGIWPDGMVADTSHLGGALLEELADVYGVPIDAADRKSRHDNIELFNGDLLAGLVKVLKDSKLAGELSRLQWVIGDHGELKEPKGKANHLSDSAIYARAKANHLFVIEPGEPPPEPGTPEAIQAAADESLQKLLHPPEEDIFGGNIDTFGFEDF